LTVISETYRKVRLNRHAFDSISEDSAYWIGFLMADGCVDSQNRITIRLKASDIGHLVKFKDFMQSGSAIRNSVGGSGTEIRGITVCSKDLTIKLGEYGVKPNKSLDAVCPGILLDNRDFWRGVVDGDGSLNQSHKDRPLSTGYIRFSLCGSYTMMHQFQDFLRIQLGFDGIYRNHGKIAEIQVNGSKAKKLVEYLYARSTVYLDRKYETAIKFIQCETRPCGGYRYGVHKKSEVEVP